MSEKRGRGRPAFEPTDEQRKNVEITVGLGIPQVQICALVRDKKDRPIDVNTLEKHFRKEIDQGAGKLNAKVGNFMVATILGTPIPDGSGITPITDEKARTSLMQQFMRARVGWRETVRNEIANADGKPFIYQANKTDSKL